MKSCSWKDTQAQRGTGKPARVVLQLSAESNTAQALQGSVFLGVMLRCMQELGEDAKARAGRQYSFSFLQQHGEQLWQPAFLTSIDHQPSQPPPTPRLANPRAAPDGPEQHHERMEQQHQQQLASLEEDTPTPFSEVSFLGHLNI